MATYKVYREDGDPFGSSFRRQWCTLQNEVPYVKPLPYESRYGTWTSPKVNNYMKEITSSIPLANGQYSEANPSLVEANNKALDKLYEKLGQSEALLVAWKERQSALDLVASNVGRLVQVARAVKRRDPKIVRRVMKRNPSAKDVVKTPAGLWLEYHFAIVPTILDIHHAASVLGFEFPIERLSFASGAENSFRRYRGGMYDWYKMYQFQSIVKLSGEIYALNPNVHLASMLGFGQPLSVAWEMTPFSWFIDYFVNVGQLVTNLQPRFPGVKTRYESTTILQKGSGWLGYRDRQPLHELPTRSFKSARMKRSLGWPPYQLQFNSPLDLEGQQCSYITAVLVNILADMKPKS